MSNLCLQVFSFHNSNAHFFHLVPHSTKYFFSNPKSEKQPLHSVVPKMLCPEQLRLVVVQYHSVHFLPRDCLIVCVPTHDFSCIFLLTPSVFVFLLCIHSKVFHFGVLFSFCFEIYTYKFHICIFVYDLFCRSFLLCLKYISGRFYCFFIQHHNF